MAAQWYNETSQNRLSRTLFKNDAFPQKDTLASVYAIVQAHNEKVKKTFKNDKNMIRNLEIRPSDPTHIIMDKVQQYSDAVEYMDIDDANVIERTMRTVNAEVMEMANDLHALQQRELSIKQQIENEKQRLEQAKRAQALAEREEEETRRKLEQAEKEKLLAKKKEEKAREREEEARRKLETQQDDLEAQQRLLDARRERLREEDEYKRRKEELKRIEKEEEYAKRQANKAREAKEKMEQRQREMEWNEQKLEESNRLNRRKYEASAELDELKYTRKKQMDEDRNEAARQKALQKNQEKMNALQSSLTMKNATHEQQLKILNEIASLKSEMQRMEAKQKFTMEMEKERFRKETFAEKEYEKNLQHLKNLERQLDLANFKQETTAAAHLQKLRLQAEINTLKEKMQMEKQVQKRAERDAHIDFERRKTQAMNDHESAKRQNWLLDYEMKNNRKTSVKMEVD